MAPKYCIQKHDASSLHYDLRLEHDGVALSWAVPKHPPTERGTKRLAIRVDDHSVEYMDFEGEIEDGYGAGTVELWDSGVWEPESVKEEKIVGEIRGERLSGRYVLVRMEDDNWLFFKGKEK